MGTRLAVKYPHDVEDPQHHDEDCFNKIKASIVRIHPGMLVVDVLLDEPPEGTEYDPTREEEDTAARFKTIPMAWLDAHSYPRPSLFRRVSFASFLSPRPLPRGISASSRPLAATRLRGISASRPRRRCDPPPRKTSAESTHARAIENAVGPRELL